jgi:hypothetical protein
MPIDQQNPNKSVAEQYAELINAGKLDVRNLLVAGAGLDALLPVMQNAPTTPLPEAPKTPAQVRVDDKSIESGI